MSEHGRNLDEATVAGFGDEWTAFDQRKLTGEELQRAFDAYFSVFPWGLSIVTPRGSTSGAAAEGGPDW